MDSTSTHREINHIQQAWTRSKIRCQLSEEAAVINLCISTKYIALSMDDRKVLIFRTTGETVNVLCDFGENVWSLALRDDILLTGDVKGKIHSWDMTTRCGSTNAMTGHTGTIRCLEFIDSETVISASQDATLKIWNVNDGTCRTTLSGHEKTIRAIALTSDYVISGSSDGTCRVWSLVEERCTAVLSGHNGAVYSLATDGQRVFSGGFDHEVRVWNLVTGECESILQGHTSHVRHLKLQSSFLVTAGADGQVMVWSSSDKFDLLNRIAAAHRNAVTSLQVNEEYILSGGRDGRVALRELRSGALLGDLVYGEKAVWDVRFGLGNNKSVVVASMKVDAHLDIGLLSI